MNKNKIILTFILTVLMVPTAFSQGILGSSQLKTVSGTVTGMDFVGNTISILTGDGHQMSFYVPGNAIITRDTHDIGLMDVKVSHPVTIRYDTTSAGKASVDSIIDNKPEAEEGSDE